MRNLTLPDTLKAEAYDADPDLACAMADRKGEAVMVEVYVPVIRQAKDQTTPYETL